MKFKIYKITNQLNNMSYIGQTRQSIKRRFTLHCRNDSTSTKLKTAIQENNRSNFKLELLFETECPVVADYQEVCFIKKHNTMQPNGYNIHRGGKTAHSTLRGNHTKRESVFKDKKHSQESKELMRQARLGKSPWNKGKTNVYSDAILKKMSDARKGMNAGENHWTRRK